MRPPAIANARQRAWAFVAIALLTLPSGAALAQAASVRGTVVDGETGRRLAYSAVTIVSATLERFSDDSGQFVLSDVRPGRLALRIRHIGYEPKEVSVAIEPGQVAEVRVELRRIAVTLAGLRVEAAQACVQPGRPRADVDSALATVFQQLEQNAQQ